MKERLYNREGTDFIEVEKSKSLLSELKDRRKKQLDLLLEVGAINQNEHDRLMAAR